MFFKEEKANKRLKVEDLGFEERNITAVGSATPVEDFRYRRRNIVEVPIRPFLTGSGQIGPDLVSVLQLKVCLTFFYIYLLNIFFFLRRSVLKIRIRICSKMKQS